MKKFLSLFLCLSLLLSVLSVSALAEVKGDSDAKIDATELSVTGKNSLGEMLAQEFEQSGDDQTAANRIFAVEVANGAASVDYCCRF